LGKVTTFEQGNPTCPLTLPLMAIPIPELQRMITERYQAFLALADSLTDNQFFAPLDSNRWSVAENLQHLYLSTRPVARLLAGPHEVLQQFGKPTHLPRSFEELSADYKQILEQANVKAPTSFSPRSEDVTDREIVTKQFEGAHQGVVEALATWTEEELDAYCIPHPALGLLTVREMVYFTALHSDHHLTLVRERTEL
jgi:hypothetical protein